ncbi:MAG: UDP-N-acetyl-D-glucosamine dehydrogenase [Elusimicrobia bacterium CG08_land_8_20_14_0_20_51_18]|nr:MAG: UDP-N-acetyl-D-glucosamine dehydrogenase [Elusimicrobia bacterium CG08_land_8_20_14_0_20_51_18]
MIDMEKNIREKKCRIAIIGFGYVGMPLGLEFAGSGFKVTAFEVDHKKIASVKKGKSHVQDVPDSEIKKLLARKALRITGDFSELKKQDAIIVCVPTPLRKSKDPDVSYIVSAAMAIRKNLRKGQLIILESTTYPGTTRELVLPVLEESGLKAGRDFYLAFSPERVDPGNKKYGIKNTPKVVGGIDRKSTELSALLYSFAVEKVFPVSNCETAEIVKLLENTFRAVNIAMINELALMCKKLGLNVWEVIEAAKTKPFGFMPFYPGPGIGGHCIPLDPHYLGWKMKTLNFEPRFIELAGAINSSMPEHVISMLYEIMSRNGKALSRSRVLIVGLAYKPDIADYRESPAIDIFSLLEKTGAKVEYHDPYIPFITVGGKKHRSAPLGGNVSAYDCVLIITNHSSLDYRLLLKRSKLVFDARNALKGLVSPKIYRL